MESMDKSIALEKTALSSVTLPVRAWRGSAGRRCAVSMTELLVASGNIQTICAVTCDAFETTTISPRRESTSNPMATTRRAS